MNYDQIDVLGKGTVWQGGVVDAAIESPPFAGPLLVVCMDRGEDNDRAWHSQMTATRRYQKPFARQLIFITMLTAEVTAKPSSEVVLAGR